MAALSHDGSVHGATSMDHVHTLTDLPEHGRHVAVATDESVPGVHRERAHRTTHSSAASVERMGFIASTSLAVVGLVFVAAVALGSTLASAAILHVISPNRRFDAFRAIHEPLVVAVLFGLGVLWILPPHSWAVKSAESEPQKQRHIRAQVAA
jgi:hypothetical protein